MRYVTPIGDDCDAPPGRRAAQYVRMSTDMQIYSAENQAATIAAYAATRGFTIVRTFIDEDRSGLLINNRDGLQDLLNEATSGEAVFQCILVFDVSRWGRFQDADESAHYEFICKRAGVKVFYCAEMFENDGSLISTMWKNMRRIMAGEYSRDRSALVFAGACRTARLGYKQGGTAGYGLQRVLVDQFGNPRLVLNRGERKALSTDRVILQPGRPEEVTVVQRVFRSFVIARKSEFVIAHELNEDGILNEFGRPWRMLAIRRLLTCEKYIGNYVYNQKSGKLRRKRRPNPPDSWIRRDNAFAAIVDPALFERARKILAKRPGRQLRSWPSDQDLLARLDALRQEKGRLSCAIIDNADDLPHSSLYRNRFGSLGKAFERIGYDSTGHTCFDARRKAIGTITKLQLELAGAIQRSGVSADVLRPTTHRADALVVVNKALSISVYLARCQHLGTGVRRWNVRRHIADTSDLVLVLRMKDDNQSIADYFLLPRDQIVNGKFSLWRRNREKLHDYRFGDVNGLVPPIWKALSRRMTASSPP